MKIEQEVIRLRGLQTPVRIALAADLHDEPCTNVLAALHRDPPDIIAAVGDIVEHYKWMRDPDMAYARNKNSALFLREAAKIAPLFYSFGNHELSVAELAAELAESAGAVLLNNKAVEWNGLLLGGLASVGRGETYLTTAAPNTAWLEEFAAKPGPKVLLSHHPEHFPLYIRDKNVDVVLSGHAHGGQWRFFGQGVFAPGQGLFPRYTSGLYENRLVVSRGLANTAKVPRFGNPRALVYVTLQPAE